MNDRQRFDQYRCELDAVIEITRLWNGDQGQQACNRLAEHVRQQCEISSNAEHAILLVEQTFKRGREHDKQISDTIERIKSWCKLNGIPAEIPNLPNVN